MSLLNFVRDEERYGQIRNLLKDLILQKLTNFESGNTEQAILLIDILSCPYVGRTNQENLEFKKKVLNKVKFFSDGDGDKAKENFIFGFKKYVPKLFYNWTDNDLGMELNTKRGHSVY